MSNGLLAQATHLGLKENASLTAYVIAVAAPFFGGWGVVLSAAMLIAVALIWFVPDQRIEKVIAASHPQDV